VTTTDTKDHDLDLRDDEALLDFRHAGERPDPEDRGEEGWPDPIQPASVAPSRALTGSEGSERSGPGPVLTGSWGRIPVPRPGPTPDSLWTALDDHYGPRPRYASVVFAPPPPPPPPPARLSRWGLARLRATSTLRRAARSRRWRLAVLELAVAAAIIGTVVVMTGRPAATGPQLQVSWGRQAMPAITSLIEDLTPVQREVLATGTTRPNVSAVDLVSLENGLAQAERLRPPPMAAVAAAWRAALSETSGALRVLKPAGPFPSAAAALAAASALSAAGAHLLEVGQTIPVG
jgi:hypothetical protein